jgi:hypothetical protein
MIPGHVWATEPLLALKEIGLAAVPTALSVPLIVSSTRAVSTPEAWPSVLANWTSTPG